MTRLRIFRFKRRSSKNLIIIICLFVEHWRSIIFSIRSSLCGFVSQVGLVLHGAVIESTIVGGPAYTSMQLGRGDVVLQIDGQEATDQNISSLLVGNDRPGSRLVLSVAKGGSQVIFFRT
jgi:hypothetical protein